MFTTVTFPAKTARTVIIRQCDITLIKIELSKENEIGVEVSGAVFLMCLQSRTDCIPYFFSHKSTVLKENYIFLHCKLLFSEVRHYSIFQCFILVFQNKIPEGMKHLFHCGFSFFSWLFH